MASTSSRWQTTLPSARARRCMSVGAMLAAACVLEGYLVGDSRTGPSKRHGQLAEHAVELAEPRPRTCTRICWLGQPLCAQLPQPLAWRACPDCMTGDETV